MAIARRKFNELLLQFLIGSGIPAAVGEYWQIKPEERELEKKIKQLFEYLDPEIELLMPTYLGNDERRFYGRGVPLGLKVLDKFKLGTGVTYVGKTRKVWSGAGWTGQPTITKDRGKTYLIIGAYDRSLRKIDAATNEEVWRYKFDDVIKGSSTVYVDETAREENRIVILQGSRTGRPKKGIAPSFRAISFRTGEELWKLDIKKTRSYSRDNDSSALILGDGLIFNAGENGIGYFLNSSTSATQIKSGLVQPQILSEVQLYESSDSKRHGGNLVTESSPARLGNRIFVASGSGHIYGISIEERKIVWDFYTGSDLDGTIAISKEGKLFGAIEKQYIPGKGGAIKLNPNKPPQESVEWFLPTGNRKFNSWQGGIIGSIALNDEYDRDEFPPLFATNAIDGYLYIGAQNVVTGNKVKGPLKKYDYDTPLVVFKQRIGVSISTPIFTDGNKLIAAGYSGVYLFALNWEPAQLGDKDALPNGKGDFYRLIVEETDRFTPGSSFESTPVVWDGIVRICGRDGFLYTFGQ
jgi:outer membrane protein assembly factor BamB